MNNSSIGNWLYSPKKAFTLALLASAACAQAEDKMCDKVYDSVNKLGGTPTENTTDAKFMFINKSDVPLRV